MAHTIICGNIVTNNEEVLMVQEKKQRAYEQWNLPTGKIEPGETPRDCAKREAKEETGVTVKPSKPVGIYLKPGETTETVLAIIFESLHTNNPPQLNPDYNEVLDAKWIPLSKIDTYNLRSSHIKPALNDYQSGQTIPTNTIKTLAKK